MKKFAVIENGNLEVIESSRDLDFFKRVRSGEVIELSDKKTVQDLINEGLFVIPDGHIVENEKIIPIPLTQEQIAEREQTQKYQEAYSLAQDRLIKKELEAIEKQKAQFAYITLRAKEYPSINDFADGFAKSKSSDPIIAAEGVAQMEKYAQDCLAVKAKYPKGV